MVELAKKIPPEQGILTQSPKENTVVLDMKDYFYGKLSMYALEPINDNRAIETAFNRYNRANKIFNKRLSILFQDYLDHESDIVTDTETKATASAPSKNSSQQSSYSQDARIRQDARKVHTMAKCTKYLPLDQLQAFVRKWMEAENKNIKEIALANIQALPQTELQTFVAQGITSQDSDIKRIALANIQALPQTELQAFIRQGINSQDPDIKEIALANIQALPQTELQAFVIKHLIEDYGNREERNIAKNYKNLLSKSILFSLVRTVLTQKDAPRSRIQSAIDVLSHEELCEFIRNGVMDDHVFVRAFALENIRILPYQEVFELVQNGVIEARYLPTNTPVNNTPKMPDATISQKPNNNPINHIQSPLYLNTPAHFFRHQFEKTGSETTLLGNSLKEKVIVRHVPLYAFMAWKTAYENHSFWQENGFSYIPIEPIIDFRMSKDSKLVHVCTGVLDVNLEQWTNKTNLWKAELKDQKQRIQDSLFKMKIDHGHDHNRNFCLRFERDENGNPDFSKCPKLYLIDFDYATS